MALKRGGAPVLIGFAESLAAPETAWSLLEAGFSVLAFHRTGSRAPLRRCKGVRLVEITAPERDARRAAGELGSLVRAHEAAAVVPLDDSSLWLCDAAALEAPVVGPTGGQARLAIDKRLQLEAARAAGFLVPPTGESSEAAEFPVVVKPALAIAEREGRLVRLSGHVCADERELERALEKLSGHDVLVQPLLHGCGEGLFGLAAADGIHTWSAHRRIRMMNPQGSGSSACAAMHVDPELVEPAERLLTAARWRGLFMIELLRGADRRAWFIELNGRAWGSMALARRMGLEYPAWAVRQALEPAFRPTPSSAKEIVRCRHLGRELVHLMMVLRGPRSSALTDWPSRWQTARSVLRVGRGDRWYNWRPGDSALFLDDAFRTVVDQVAGGRP